MGVYEEARYYRRVWPLSCTALEVLQFIHFVVPCQTIIIVLVLYIMRAATIVCYNSSWMYTLHTLEDLASSGDTVDVMRWMKGRITLWGSARLWWFVVTWCSSGTHVVLRALAAQASGPRFDFQHISYLTSYIKHVHVLAYFCLSCFYETTFLGIIWQMMQTQHWNVSSCLCEIVCFETERA